MDENLIIKDTLKGLVESAMKEGNQQILDWLISKIKPSYPKLYDDVMKYATESSYYEDENYKPNDLVKQYAKQYLGPLEEDHFGEEQAADLKKELGTEGDNNDTGTPYQSREEVPEQARELWDIMHALRDDPHDDRWED